MTNEDKYSAGAIAGVVSAVALYKFPELGVPEFWQLPVRFLLTVSLVFGVCSAFIAAQEEYKKLHS